MDFRRGTAMDDLRIAQMHAAQNLGYPLPPLGDRSIVTKLIAERGDKIVFAALLRLTSEAYLLASPEGTPKERWEILKTGHDHLMRLAWQDGFSDINSFLPPKMERAFGKRLLKLGWERSWPAYSIWPGVQLGL